MKVLLVQPIKGQASLAGEDFYVFEPLALEALAAPLVPHHDVKLLDMRFEPGLVDALGTFRPDVVGVTAYTVHVNRALGICADVKAWNPACAILPESSPPSHPGWDPEPGTLPTCHGFQSSPSSPIAGA